MLLYLIKIIEKEDIKMNSIIQDINKDEILFAKGIILSLKYDIIELWEKDKQNQFQKKIEDIVKVENQINSMHIQGNNTNEIDKRIELKRKLINEFLEEYEKEIDYTTLYSFLIILFNKTKKEVNSSKINVYKKEIKKYDEKEEMKGIKQCSKLINELLSFNILTEDKIKNICKNSFAYKYCFKENDEEQKKYIAGFINIVDFYKIYLQELIDNKELGVSVIDLLFRRCKDAINKYEDLKNDLNIVGLIGNLQKKITN